MPSEDGKVRYSISDGDEQQKVNLICDLLEIWVKNRSCTKKDNLVINDDISIWDYLQTEKILLALLPAFDWQGKLKDYDQYKKDVSLIRGMIWEKIEDQNLEDEEIERDFKKLISRKSQTVSEDVGKKINSIGNSEHRILFMCKVLDLALANIEDVQSWLDIFIQRINDNQEENLTNKECQRILSEIMPERNRRLQC